MEYNDQVGELIFQGDEKKAMVLFVSGSESEESKSAIKAL